MHSLIAVSTDTNEIVVKHENKFVKINTETRDVVSVDTKFMMNKDKWTKPSSSEVNPLWQELSSAAVTTLTIQDTAEVLNPETKVFRVPKKVQESSMIFGAETVTLQDIYEFVASAGIPEDETETRTWLEKVMENYPAATQNNEKFFYTYKSEDESFYVTGLYRLTEAGWSEREDGDWVSADPIEDKLVEIVDEETKDIVFVWADTDPNSPLELSIMFTEEVGLFNSAYAELDLELLDRVFDIYDTQERSVNAQKQVRGPGGKFTKNPGGAESTRDTPVARLEVDLPLLDNPAARIDEYLQWVEEQRGGSAPAEGAEELSTSEFNWVEDVGGLPSYIKRISKHLRSKGMAEGHAIATAVNAAKKMCATGDLNWPGLQNVNAGSRSEACASVASWEAKKAKAKATSVITEESDALESSLSDMSEDTLNSLSEFVSADMAGVAETDVAPLYLAIVDDIDTDAVLDVIALVPPKPGVQGDVTGWRRQNGQWVSAQDYVTALRGSTPPSVKELTDPNILTNVLEQVDKATATEQVDEPAQGETEVAPDGTDPNAVHPEAASTRDIALGLAYPDGSLLIKNAEDLKKQIFNVSDDDQRLHVIRRAKALNRLDVLPKDWDTNNVNADFALWGPYGEIIPLSAAGGADRNRGNAERLRRYWTSGLGGAKVAWRTPGDWTRCVAHLSKYLGARAKGYCALRHKEMNGYWPGSKQNR